MEKKENLTRNNTESPKYFLESPADPCVLLTKTRQKEKQKKKDFKNRFFVRF